MKQILQSLKRRRGCREGWPRLGFSKFVAIGFDIKKLQIDLVVDSWSVNFPIEQKRFPALIVEITKWVITRWDDLQLMHLPVKIMLQGRGWVDSVEVLPPPYRRDCIQLVGRKFDVLHNHLRNEYCPFTTYGLPYYGFLTESSHTDH